MENFLSSDGPKLLKNTIKPHLIKDKYDALFILLHSYMQCGGFKLVGLGESENAVENKELPMEWNESRDSWSFRYRHPRSSMTFLLKAIRLGRQLLIHALAVEQNEILNLDLNVDEFVVDRNSYEVCQQETGGEQREIVALDFYTNLDKLHETFRRAIMVKLLPTVSDITAQSNASSSSSSSASTTASTSSAVGSSSGSSRIPSVHPTHDRYTESDPLRIGPPRRPPHSYPHPFGVGDNDLLPGPGGGFGYIPGASPYSPYYPDPFRGGGGSLVGPNHPGFGIRDPFAPPFPPGGGGGRGNFPYPPPPGARYDPYGPPGVRPNPDPDHLPPPGSNHYDDMFM